MRLTLGILSFIFLVLSATQNFWFLLPFLLTNFFFVFSLTTRLSHILTSSVYFLLDFFIAKFVVPDNPFIIYGVIDSAAIYLIFLTKLKNEEGVLAIAVFKFLWLTLFLSANLPFFMVMAIGYFFIYFAFLLNLFDYQKKNSDASGESSAILAMILSLIFIEAMLILSYFFIGRSLLLFSLFMVYLVLSELLKKNYGPIFRFSLFMLFLSLGFAFLTSFI